MRPGEKQGQGGKSFIRRLRKCLWCADMGSLDKIMHTLENEKEGIRTAYHVRKVGVFGSVARGEEKKRSDVDVLVEFTDAASLFDLVGLSDFLAKKLGRKVEVVSKRAMKPDILRNALKDAVFA